MGGEVWCPLGIEGDGGEVLGSKVADALAVAVFHAAILGGTPAGKGIPDAGKGVGGEVLLDAVGEGLVAHRTATSVSVETDVVGVGGIAVKADGHIPGGHGELVVGKDVVAAVVITERGVLAFVQVCIAECQCLALAAVYNASIAECGIAVGGKAADIVNGPGSTEGNIGVQGDGASAAGTVLVAAGVLFANAAEVDSGVVVVGESATHFVADDGTGVLI